MEKPAINADSISRLTTGLASLLPGLVLFAAPLPAEASLEGDLVDFEHVNYATGGGFLDSRFVNEVLVGDGIETEFDVFPFVDIGATSITLLGSSSSPVEFGLMEFDRIVLTDLDWVGGAGEIVDVVLSSSFNVTYLDLSDVTFGPHSFEIGLERSLWGLDSSITFGLTTAHSPIPLPPALALFLFAIGLLAVLRVSRAAATGRFKGE